MDQEYQQYCQFNNKLLIIGFGSIGQAILALLFRHIHLLPSQVLIITKDELPIAEHQAIVAEYGITLEIASLTKDNYIAIMNEKLKAHDFVLNLSIDVCSADLITYCQAHQILYLDTCIEPWAGGYVDPSLSPSARSNYAIRDSLLALRNRGQARHEKQSTALVAHGANPGMVSHFLKQALLNIAHDTGLQVSVPQTQTQWAQLANQLNIKAIHIAERDTQITTRPKRVNEFVNTWSVNGFIAEGSQPAELGWGTHERHWPQAGVKHDFGSGCAIYLNRPGAATRVRTWTPLSGPFHGFLMTHSEAISIADYLTLIDGEQLHYRPTVHFAYHPCEDAVLSVHEFVGREWQPQTAKRLLFDEIIDGVDELGVLLMGHARGAYWFGSQLSIHEARVLAPRNNATTLQVAAGTLAGVIWVMTHPYEGIVEPDQIDFQYIMNIATPYLGKVAGFYTDWTPLTEREKLFTERLDRTDPWQFINVLVE